ncbi:hypothetical protein [Micromonospora sp. NBC_01412]|uniref:hypothetical protein n=1 Tax=Micromonospora sp. NBC_01412 TaxID=2903590 RepID=UPI0032459930
MPFPGPARAGAMTTLGLLATTGVLRELFAAVPAAVPDSVRRRRRGGGILIGPATPHRRPGPPAE